MMSKKETKKRIREEMRAERADYDARTRHLLERIEYHASRAAAQRERPRDDS